MYKISCFFHCLPIRIDCDDFLRHDDDRPCSRLDFVDNVTSLDNPVRCVFLVPLLLSPFLQRSGTLVLKFNVRIETRMNEMRWSFFLPAAIALDCSAVGARPRSAKL